MRLETVSAIPTTTLERVGVEKTNTPDRLLTAAAVKARCGGISDMTLWRWTRDEELGFPKPIKIQRIRYWSELALEAWLKAQREPDADC